MSDRQCDTDLDSVINKWFEDALEKELSAIPSEEEMEAIYTPSKELDRRVAASIKRYHKQQRKYPNPIKKIRDWIVGWAAL